jgi:creatinine amidohydrolase
MRLAEMTWQEVDALDRATIVVVPFGAMEQHGRHLPFETDALIAETLCRRLDESLGGRLLVLPTQWLGLSTHHMGFPGSLTASVDTYLALAAEIIGSIAHCGFLKILVLNAHGGNSTALDVVLTKLRLSHPATRIVLVTYWNIAARELAAIRESEQGGMGHACELETSLLLAVKPEVVRVDRVQADGKWPASAFFARDMLAGGPAAVSRSFSEISTFGAVGDPRTASPEKGEQFLEAIVARLGQLVRDFDSGALEKMQSVGTEK